MSRRVYLADDVINMSEYLDMEDDLDCYACWQDEGTQDGYNHKSTETFEEFAKGSIESRFIATIIRLSDNARIGSIFVSPENTEPDLAVMIYKPYRGKGYGSRAFALGVKYCFEVLSLEYIHAGCYPHNSASLKMIKKCGFRPYPEGNLNEKHYLTGEDITQLDFVQYNPVCIKFENEYVIGVPSTDADGKVFNKTLIGSYVIIPKSHVPTPFDLSEQEWAATKKMMDEIKLYLDKKYKPNGYNLGWNVGKIAGQVVPYAHLHIIPRHKDEPFAGKGIRHWLKKSENMRPS